MSRSRHLFGEIKRFELLRADRRDLRPLGQNLFAWAAATQFHATFVRALEIVRQMLVRRDVYIGRRVLATDRRVLEIDQVREVVLDRPPRKIAFAVPVFVTQLRTEFLDDGQLLL